MIFLATLKIERIFMRSADADRSDTRSSRVTQNGVLRIYWVTVSKVTVKLISNGLFTVCSNVNSLDESSITYGKVWKYHASGNLLHLVLINRLKKLFKLDTVSTEKSVFCPLIKESNPRNVTTQRTLFIHFFFLQKFKKIIKNRRDPKLLSFIDHLLLTNRTYKITCCFIVFFK